MNIAAAVDLQFKIKLFDFFLLV